MQALPRRIVHRAGKPHTGYTVVIGDASPICQIQGTRVEFDMIVRRFRCRTAGCPRRIFSERFPTTMGHYARETRRRKATLENVACYYSWARTVG